MTTVLDPQAGEGQAQGAGPGCGCCIPPPGASMPEGRQRALADLQARRDALERRLKGLR